MIFLIIFYLCRLWAFKVWGENRDSRETPFRFGTAFIPQLLVTNHSGNSCFTEGWRGWYSTCHYNQVREPWMLSIKSNSNYQQFQKALPKQRVFVELCGSSGIVKSKRRIFFSVFIKNGSRLQKLSAEICIVAWVPVAWM